MNEPAGITTISGQNGHGLPSLSVSVNTSPAVRDERLIWSSWPAAQETGGFRADAPLPDRQRLPRLRADHPVGGADIEALRLQTELRLLPVATREAERCSTSAGDGLMASGAGGGAGAGSTGRWSCGRGFGSGNRRDGLLVPIRRRRRRRARSHPGRSGQEPPAGVGLLCALQADSASAPVGSGNGRWCGGGAAGISGAGSSRCGEAVGMSSAAGAKVGGSGDGATSANPAVTPAFAVAAFSGSIIDLGGAREGLGCLRGPTAWRCRRPGEARGAR